MSEICSAQSEYTITDVISQLESHDHSESPLRYVASLKSTAQKATTAQLDLSLRSEISENERDSLQSWSQSELKKVEAYLDWTNLHREDVASSDQTRRHLTDIANRLVAFHGYAHDGRVSRMVASLKAIETDRKELQALVCHSR